MAGDKGAVYSLQTLRVALPMSPDKTIQASGHQGRARGVDPALLPAVHGPLNLLKHVTHGH